MDARNDNKVKSDKAKKSEMNHDFFNEIMENISDAFVALDQNWIYTYVNTKAGELFNRKPEDLVGKHIWTEFPEGVNQNFYHAYQESYKKQIPMQMEEYYPPWNRWYENRIQPYKGGLLIFFQDITERKNRELEMLRLNNLLTESQHLGKMGTWVWNIEERKGWLSVTMYQLLGVFKTEHQITLKEFIDYIHPDDKKRMEKIIVNRINKPKDFCTEFRVIDNSGSIRYFRTEAKLYYDQHRNPEKLIGIVVDITESELDKNQIRNFNKELAVKVREKTSELQQTQSNLQALIENTMDGIWAVNKDKIITIYNSAFAKSYHLFSGNHLKPGLSISQVLDPLSQTKELEYWNMIIDRVLNGESFKDVYEIKLSGKKHIFLISCHPIIVKKQITGATFFSKDITRFKHGQNKILRLNEELNRKVSELKEINEDLNSFTYSVSHDLRAPLRAINGLSGMLLSHIGNQINDSDRKLIERVIANATKLENLIQDLLAFSRVSKKEVSRDKIIMNNLVTSVAREVLEDMNAEKDLIKVNDLPSANADYSLISQVFYNLLSNAVKFSSKKKDPQIEVGSLKEKDKIVFYVKDNGAGFDMKYAGKIFEVFQRLHQDSEFEGTGVGLAIVKKIIGKHNGEIWVESKVGEGTTFFLTF